MTALLDGLKALGPARLLAMAAVALGTLGLLAVLALRGGSERMALLYGDLDLRDAAQVVESLNRQHIAYQIAGQGADIMVPATDVARARLGLAKEALPSGGSIGYEIFDRSDGLAATQFQQTINQTRALEGELSRTIRSISGVRGARVHLVLPKREPFARDRQEAQASVMLTMAGTARLDREGTQTILNLVAAAVPGLRAQNITLADSRGNLLARAGDTSGQVGDGQSAEELRHTTESRLARGVEEMLERSLGPGKVRAEAAVEMDFDHVNETQEKFDPDGQVVRSTQTSNGASKSSEANAAVTVQNNLPNADAGNSGSGSQETKQEETTNYEIGKTVRTLVREQPQIRRISLAVMVDGVAGPGRDDWKERTPEELARITNLVRGAIGFDEKRGDHVEVLSMRFAQDDQRPAADTGWLGLPIEKPDLLRLAETALLGIVAVLALLLVVRPMVIRLTTAPAEARLSADGLTVVGGDFPALPAPAGTAGVGSAGRLADQRGGDASAALLEDDSMVNMANIEGQMRASSIRRLAELVERNPQESLTVVRTWLTQGST